MKKRILLGILVLLITGGLTGIASAYGDTVPPISCSNVPFVFTRPEGGGGTLNTVSFSDGTASLTKFCPLGTATYSATYSAIGFRSTERVLYALNCSASPVRPVKIDGNCIVHNLNIPDGLPNTCLWAGDISSDGKYWYLHRGEPSSIDLVYRIDLNDVNGNMISITVTNIGEYNIHDWAYYNGFIYGGLRALGNLSEVDITAVPPPDPIVTVYGLIPQTMLKNQNFAAAWFDSSDSHIYLYRAGAPGYVYGFNPGSLNTIDSTRTAPTIVNADGAYCPAPVIVTPEFPALAFPLITIVGLLLTIVAVRRMR